VDFYKILV